MAVRVITPPAALITVAQAKQNLRIEPDETQWDTIIVARIAAASAMIDGPGGWLDRAIGTQTLEWSAPRCDIASSKRVLLPYPTVLTVTSVKYDDSDAVEQTYDAASYRLTARGEVELITGYSWPTTRLGSDAVRIRYTAGYAVIPPPIIQAVQVMVADMTAFAESAVTGLVNEVPMSTTVEALLGPFKVWSL